MLNHRTAEQDVRDSDNEIKRQKLRDMTKQAGGEDAVVMNLQGGGQGATRSVGRIALMASLQQKLVDAEVEIEMSKARVEALRAEEAAPNGGVTDAQLEAAIGEDAGLIKLKRDLQHREQTLQSYGPNAKQR